MSLKEVEEELQYSLGEWGVDITCDAHIKFRQKVLQGGLAMASFVGSEVTYHVERKNIFPLNISDAYKMVLKSDTKSFTNSYRYWHQCHDKLNVGGFCEPSFRWHDKLNVGGFGEPFFRCLTKELSHQELLDTGRSQSMSVSRILNSTLYSDINFIDMSFIEWPSLNSFSMDGSLKTRRQRNGNSPSGRKL